MLQPKDAKMHWEGALGSLGVVLQECIMDACYAVSPFVSKMQYLPLANKRVA